MKCFTKEQRRSSNNPRECDTTTTSPFLSIRPSQSASHVTLNHDHEERCPPEPAIIHSRVMNAPAFGEPITPSIATTITIVANTTRPRPLSVQLHYYHHHQVLHRLQRRHPSHLHTRNRHRCAKPYTVPAPWSLKNQRGERTKVKEDDKFPPSVARSGSPKAPHLVCDAQRRKSTHVPCGSLRRMLLKAMRQGCHRRGSISTVVRRPSSPSWGVGMP